jgi:tetratricopeptide (TPR) repeat protein
MLEFLFKELYEPLKERRKRLALEVVIGGLGASLAMWLTSGQPVQTRLLWLFSVGVVALWYAGLARRVPWSRSVLGLAVTATAFWGLAARSVWTAAERHTAEIFRIAEKLERRGFYVAARDKLRRECGSEMARIECPCTLGVYDAHLGDTSSARANFQACVAKAIELDRLDWQTAGLVDLGDLEEEADRNDLAAQYLRNGLDLATRAKNDYGVYRAKVGFARLAAKVGRYGEARTLASDALAIAEHDNQKGAGAQVRLLLGDDDLAQGAFSRALAHYNAAALAYDAVADTRGRTTVDWHVAHMHRQQDALDLARAEYKRALGVLQLWEDKGGQAEVLLGLADVERVTKRYGLAREYFDQALHLFEDIEDLLGQANVLIEYAHMETRTGNWSAARERYGRARTLSQRAESGYSEANALRGLADLERHELPANPKSKAVRVQRATDYLAQARRLYQAGGHALGEANVDITEALLMYQIGRPEEGAIAWKRAMAAYARLGMGATVRRMAEDIDQQIRMQGLTPPARPAVQ